MAEPALSRAFETKPNNLEAFWMPFTANRAVQEPAAPAGRRQGHALHHRRRPPDAGRHRRPVVRQCRPWPPADHRGGPRPGRPSSTTRRPSRWAIPSPSSWPRGSTQLLARRFDHVFFTNSGSEAVDTALKIALAYHRAEGRGPRARLIGRERGYHGVGFGGISVGGIVANRKMFGSAADRRRSSAPHPRSREERLHPRPAGLGRAPRRRSRAAGHPARCLDHRRGDRRAGRRLDRRAGPAQGLSRSACARSATKHGILLIFDEVITGFGRLGACFAAEYFGVVPT